MPIDINSLPFDDEPIEGLAEASANWQEASEFPPLPKPGVNTFCIANIRDVSPVVNKEGHQRVAATLDYKIVGGPDDDKTITFVRVSNVEFDTHDRGRTSIMLDLVKSAGFDTLSSNMDFIKALREMEDTAKLFKAQGDWQGNCGPCYKAKLRQITGKVDDADAKKFSTKEQRKEAGKYSLKAKRYRDFPPHKVVPDAKAEFFVCNDCGAQVRASYNIVRYLESTGE